MQKKSLGKGSVGLIVAMSLLYIIGTSFTNSLYKSIPAGGTILADIAARPALALTILAGMVAGISAFITGLMAIIRQKEHALLVYVASSIGALLLLFLAGEIFPPNYEFVLRTARIVRNQHFNGIVFLFQLASLASILPAQQSMHWMLGILPHFRAFSSLRVFPTLKKSPRPPSASNGNP